MVTHKSTDYQSFLSAKMQRPVYSGFDVESDQINPALYPFQRDIVRWALRLGKAALFEECGLGKTAQQLEWAKHVATHTGGKVLILAPLAVAAQTVREGVKFGIDVKHVREPEDIGDAQIVITNYERLDKFDCSQFAGIVLDESSILKSFTGKTKRMILAAFEQTPYKLACTATPAPNDHMELANHAEFLNMATRDEMLANWFVHDGGATQEWRLKGHAAKDFWRWLTSWAVCISKPGDLGDQYEMPSFNLPELIINEHHLLANQDTIDRAWQEGRLLPDTNPSSTTLHKVKRESLEDRINEAVEIADSIPDDEPVVIWCDTNYEADALVDAFPDALEIRGSSSVNVKEAGLKAFSDGENLMLITKPDIAGFGLNWQHCGHMIFVGVSFSFEKFYQAVRRCHRFGRTNPVNCHVIYAETEGNVITALKAKQDAFDVMQTEMTAAMHEYGLFRDIDRSKMQSNEYYNESGRDWTLMRGDCVDRIKEVESDSIDFVIYSPPFANLYVYSDHMADMGNSRNDDEFFDHYRYLLGELYRVTTPGRLNAVHCMDLPTHKWKDGEIGIKDFSGQIIQAHIDAGFVYHSRITIWKDPVTAMQRTKAHGLLHKTFTKDAAKVRVGIPDYLLIFRKPGDNPSPVKQRRKPGDYIGTEPPVVSGHSNYSIDVWQRYASPVWFDIDQSNTLNNYRDARENEDERHIAPLQLDVIERAIDLWTNTGDMVLSPFAGIGSEGYSALKLDRKFTGIELKESYFKIAVANLNEIITSKSQMTLFDMESLKAKVS